MTTATELRARFRALPKEQREEHEDFAIRMWRALSWLERAEAGDPADIENRFISAWIAFNALYGQIGPDNQPWGDREARDTFLAHVWRIDQRGQLSDLLQMRQTWAFRIIEDKFLSTQFWEVGDAAKSVVRDELQNAMKWVGTPRAERALHMLFDRLYVLRNQLLHGASTKGSKLNRRALKECGTLLLAFLPLMIDVLIKFGIAEDWGKVCFRPEGPAVSAS
jgi:hypothetical protein